MTSLLCTLGSSWAVVPEAYLLGNEKNRYDSVLVLTTAGTKDSVEKCTAWFRQHYPSVALKILAIENLQDLACAADHHRFEEALFRCYFSLLDASDGGSLHLCLAGGFKTMSSAAHQTADLFGCSKLFHITTPVGKRFDTHETILRGITEGEIRLIDLGGRPGWPTMRELEPEAPSLPTTSGLIAITDTVLRDKIYARLDAANHLMANEKELYALPFPQIARWPPGDRDWLDQPLDAETDADWIQTLPKIELHCHLGGFATHGDLLDQVEAAAHSKNIAPRKAKPLPADWPHPKTPCGLQDYMQFGDDNGSRLLKDPGCLEKHIQLLYQHLQQQNIHYAEIRCSPANYVADGQSPWDVLTRIQNTFQACMDAAAVDSGKFPQQTVPRVNLIIIATRRPDGSVDYRSDISRHLALAVTAAGHWQDETACQVVGVDLAGYEHRETRAHYFREEFTAVHRCGLALTIHAGENDDSQGIWSAVFDLNTRRIGHALHLLDSPDLLRSVADRRIGIEMCPYANLQIKGYPSDQDQPSNESYPLLRYLDAGIAVTVNTDNPGISAASLSDNFLLLPRLCPGIKRIHVLRLLRNAIEQSFARNKNQLINTFHIHPGS